MKHTAVEIVENKVEAEAIALFDGELTFNEFMDNISKYFNQAKEMEKEQHQETFNQARLTKMYEKDMTPLWDSYWQYFNTTFKSE